VILLGESKSLFGSSSVRLPCWSVLGGADECDTAGAFPVPWLPVVGLNLACSDEFPLPTDFVVAPSTILVGMSWLDLLAGVIDVILEYAVAGAMVGLNAGAGMVWEKAAKGIKKVGKKAGKEVAEKLVKEGAAMGYLDLGGGLAVDYDGSKTNYQSSRNYSVEEYCYDIVETISSLLNKSSIEHPTIITESGRYTVAYYSILLFNVLDVTAITPRPIPDQLPKTTYDLLDNLLVTYNMVSAKDIQECYNDAFFYKSQAQQLFKHGQITMRDKAIADDLHRHILIKITKVAKELDYVPEEIAQIEKLIPDIYYGNFSLFQSLPDVWAIDQLFPICPIHRLSEAPTRSAIIADITCDCDGRIDSFPSYPHARDTIYLHKLENDEEYYLGVFLVGAYQETLGDLHNLFGDTNVASIQVRDDGTYEFVRDLEGDSVEDVLSYVEYDVKAIKKRMKDFAENSIRQGFISVKERKTILNTFNEGLRGYTYFEKE